MVMENGYFRSMHEILYEPCHIANSNTNEIVRRFMDFETYLNMYLKERTDFVCDGNFLDFDKNGKVQNFKVKNK